MSASLFPETVSELRDLLRGGFRWLAYLTGFTSASLGIGPDGMLLSGSVTASPSFAASGSLAVFAVLDAVAFDFSARLRFPSRSAASSLGAYRTSGLRSGRPVCLLCRRSTLVSFFTFSAIDTSPDQVHLPDNPASLLDYEIGRITKLNARRNLVADSFDAVRWLEVTLQSESMRFEPMLRIR